MKIVEIVDSGDGTFSSVCDVQGFLNNVKGYKAKNEKNKEIIKFLIEELERIAEWKNSRDIQKYKSSITYYVLEDQGLHDDAMKLKIDFYSKGGKFPYLPMVSLFSLLKK